MVGGGREAWSVFVPRTPGESVRLPRPFGLFHSFCCARFRRGNSRSPQETRFPWCGYELAYYAKRPRPLSRPEQVLYHRLVSCVPEHIFLAQVQVVLGVQKGFSFHEWNNRINRLSYDFVICSKDSTVLAEIELDDKHTNRYQARKPTERQNHFIGGRPPHPAARESPWQIKMRLRLFSRKLDPPT